MRYATVTFRPSVELEPLTNARLVGAGNGSDVGMDLLFRHDHGTTWVNTEQLQGIEWSAETCDWCHRPVAEDDEGVTVREHPWHLDCWVGAHQDA